MKSRRILAGLVVVTCVWTACAGKVPRPTPAHVDVARASWPDTTLDELSEGRRLYVRRCSGCHNLVLPWEHTAAEWPKVMAEMGSEYAKMNEEQQEKALRFILTAREMHERSATSP